MTAEDEPIIGDDVFVQFTSQVGNRIVHPSQWTTEDNGDAFTLTSPDEQAVVSVLTFTVEGSGTLSEFQLTVVSGLEGDWHDSEWTDIEIGGMSAKKRHLVSRDKNAETCWRVYVVRNGELYHAILLNASLLAMEINGEFYESFIQSFLGISSIPS
jgi:hypothetical protein